MSETANVAELPGAKFIGVYVMFPEMANQAYVSEKQSLDALNVQAKSSFEYQCRQWMAQAEVARATKVPLPPKPISPKSRIVVRQEVGAPNAGTWMAQTDGPDFGVCPDLPPVVVPAPSGTIGGDPATRKADPSAQLADLLMMAQSLKADTMAIKAKLGV